MKTIGGGFSATVPRFNLRKKRGKKTMEKLMKLMKLFLSLGGFWNETQQLVEVARTSWSPALNLDSFVAMNFSGPDILRLQSLVMLGLLLQPQAVPESTRHLKPGDISDSNSSWIPCGVVVTPTYCQKGRWGEHILRSIMTLYAYKELLNTARQASSCIFRNCGKKKRWMIWNWQYCVCQQGWSYTKLQNLYRLKDFHTVMSRLRGFPANLHKTTCASTHPHAIRKSPWIKHQNDVA